MSHFDKLPNDIIVNIALHLDNKNIIYYLQINNTINNLLNNLFWYQKFVFEYGDNFCYDKNTNWKENYFLSGSMYVTGANNCGQLGLNDTNNRYIPTQIDNIKAKSVSCGINYTIIIDIDNNVWAMGSNYYGQLGLNDTNNRLLPTKIDNPNIKAKSVSCGERHTIIIDIDNNVWAMGNNYYGQLGLNDKKNRLISTKLVLNHKPIKAKSVSCGAYYTIIIDIENNVWAMGCNYFGQLGLNDTIDRLIPTKLVLNHKPIKAKSVSCGLSHTMIIDIDNNIWSMGSNARGQLGLNDITDRLIPTILNNIKAKSVSCGNYHTMIIDIDNNLWAMGINHNGQLGLNDTNDRLIPTQLVLNHKPIKAKSVNCGFYHTIIIDIDNNVWAMGSNYSGQLGLKNTIDRLIPTQNLFYGLSYDKSIKAKSVSCGPSHTIIIK